MESANSERRSKSVASTQYHRADTTVARSLYSERDQEVIPVLF